MGVEQLRASSQGVSSVYDRDYDLHYQDVDKALNNPIWCDNGARLITKAIHGDYNLTDGSSDYFLLNGRSFPYTFRESLVLVAPGEPVRRPYMA